MPETRWIVLVAAALLVAVALLRVTACDDGSPPARAGQDAAAPDTDPGPAGTEPAIDPAVGADAGTTEETIDEPSSSGRMQAIVYFPDDRSLGLIGEPREIFRTASPGDRAKQIVADLIAGPQSDRALRAVPASVTLRQVFVLEDGTAWVDLGGNLAQEITGGSRHELLVVYAIVNSVAANVSEVRRVGILVNGRPIETLAGHLDLRRALPPDRSLIVGTIGGGSSV